eukprot:TRINITY_DN7068_c0_g1_i1.p1 TRINITY_DN7068_c0_g1~~TRINITY_DN7068_c0_g1_i1.p1  ORF type:complete len:519 (-),score=62.37 TRINITY_DN7068_c0_g1_i1:6-1535(-)
MKQELRPEAVGFTMQKHDWKEETEKFYPIKQEVEFFETHSLTPCTYRFCIASLRGGTAPWDPDRLAFTNAVQQLSSTKARFDHLPDRYFVPARCKANPYECIGNGIFTNRAAMKMLEIDSVCKMTSQELLAEENGCLYFADICAGPGGWTEYVLWRIYSQDQATAHIARERNRATTAKGFGLTLREHTESMEWKLHQFEETARKNVNPDFVYWGPKEDSNGDITKPEIVCGFAERIKSMTGGRGVALLMADGGFSVDGNWNAQETLLRQIIMCEVLTALMCVRKGGWFMCKLFDLFTEFTIDILYILWKSFGSIALLKPLTSRPANSEKYIICKDKLDHPLKTPVPDVADLTRPLTIADCDGDLGLYLFRVSNQLRNQAQAGDIKENIDKEQAIKEAASQVLESADDICSIVDREVHNGHNGHNDGDRQWRDNRGGNARFPRDDSHKRSLSPSSRGDRSRNVKPRPSTREEAQKLFVTACLDYAEVSDGGDSPRAGRGDSRDRSPVLCR